MTHTQLIVFIMATIGNVAFSRRTLLDPRCHGFYRFFVFESNIALITLNIHNWYQERTAVDVASTALLYLAVFYALSGLYLLYKVGKPRAEHRKATDLTFENTSTLVKVGPYKHIRHPMYASLMCFSVGTLLKAVNSTTVVLTIASILFSVITAKVEERESLERFGAEYERYRSETKMFIPFVW
jgi:protein-S-isoprenylcysteine O-methyltransferase Ste14